MINESNGMDLNLNSCNCGEVNARDYSNTYKIFNLVVTMTMLPVVASFGLLSNCMNIYIFTRPSFVSSPSNVFLLSLSCSDFFTVLTGVFMFCTDSYREYFPSLTELATHGSIWALPLGCVTQTCSVYFTLAAAVDCYLKVCKRRPNSRHACTVIGARLVCIGVTLFSFAYNAPRFWQFELNRCIRSAEIDQNRTDHQVDVEFCPTQFHDDIRLVYNVYMYTILMTLLPFVSLTVLSMLIIRDVQKKRKHATRIRCLLRKNGLGIDPLTSHGLRSLVRVCSAHRSNDTDWDDDGIIAMIMVVILFLACNTLSLVVNIVEALFDPTDKLSVQFMTDASNFLVVLNSSINIIIYMLYDQAYHDEFNIRFRKKKPQHSNPDEIQNEHTFDYGFTRNEFNQSKLEPEYWQNLLDDTRPRIRKQESLPCYLKKASRISKRSSTAGALHRGTSLGDWLSKSEENDS